MADKMLIIPLHIGDLIKDTYTLDATEFGAYMRLIIAHYNIGEQGLPDDDKQLAKLAGCNAKVWARISTTVRQMFTWTDGFGKRQRILKELVEYQARVSIARSNALKRYNSTPANPPANDLPNDCQNDANPLLTINHKPLTNKPINQKEEIEASPPLVKDLKNEYAFQGEVVKVKWKDWQKWIDAYPHINVLEHAKGCDKTFAKEKAEGRDITGWFFRLPAALAKANLKRQTEIREAYERGGAIL